MANKPIIFYAIEDLIEVGVNNIGIIVGPNREQVEKIVMSEDWDVDIEFIYQGSPQGLAHAVLISESFIMKEPFVMYLGDNILRNGISEHVRKFVDSGAYAPFCSQKSIILRGSASLNKANRVNR